jgi:uncharacterized protein HemY
MLERNEFEKIMLDVRSKIDELISVIEKFEDCHAKYVAYERVEDSLMWINKLAHQVPIKVKSEEKKEEKSTVQ